MSNVATVGPRWRPVDRALLWDESGLAKSIAQIVAKSVPGACLDLAEDADDLLELLVARAPDIVFVAVRNPAGPAIAVIERLHRVCPSARVVAVGTRMDPAALSAAIAAGARGFVILEQNGDTALNGSSRSRRTGWDGRPIEHRPSLAVTDRELQILRGMTDGFSNLEIAKQLFVSEDTVKTHARRLFRKLGANDRAHAVALGMRFELVA
ncbi:MAG: response regulator transcription factor [Nakamurella multipartita]